MTPVSWRRVVRTPGFFLDSGNEDSDAQVFLNIDPAAARVEFHEKDMDFRTPLLEALMEPRDPAKQVL